MTDGSCVQIIVECDIWKLVVVMLRNFVIVASVESLVRSLMLVMLVLLMLMDLIDMVVLIISDFFTFKFLIIELLCFSFFFFFLIIKLELRSAF